MTEIKNMQDYIDSAKFKEQLSKTSKVPGTDIDWISYEKENFTFFIREFKKLNKNTRTFQIKKPQFDLLLALEQKLPNSSVTIWVVEDYIMNSSQDPVWVFTLNEILEHVINVDDSDSKDFAYNVSIENKDWDYVYDISAMAKYDFYQISKKEKSHDFILGK